MRSRWLSLCLLLFGIFWALSILGCAPLTLEGLHALHPPARTYVVCRAPLRAPPGTRFFAHRRWLDRIWWDADPESLKQFIRQGVDGIYEVIPEAPAYTARDLPPPSDALTCGSTPIVAINEHRGSKSLELAIEETLHRELIEVVDELKQSAKPDARHLAQPVEPRAPREPVFSPDQVNKFLKLVDKALREGSPVAQMSDPPGPEHPVVQTLGGAGAGVAISLVPMGSVGADVAERAGALRKPTKDFRLGKDIGQLLGGIGQIVVGCGGMGLGAGATATGVGAPGGLVITAESAGVFVNGWVNVCAASADGIQLMLHWGDDGGSSETAPEQSAPTETPAAKPVAPAQPARAKPTTPSEKQAPTPNKASGTNATAPAKPAQLEPYKDGRGHHVPAKKAFEGPSGYVPGYDPKKALAIPNAELMRLKIDHAKVTGEQMKAYKKIAQTNTHLTWESIGAIETDVLVRAGMKLDLAKPTVAKAIQALKDAGVVAPIRIPWGK